MTLGRLRNIIILLTLLSTWFSCAQKEESADVVILYTTDVHGNVLPYDFNKNKPNNYSLANASTLIKQLQGEYDRNLLLFDAGDFVEGTPSMYFYNFYAPKEEHLIARVANYLKYDLLVFGNHDLEVGEAMIQKFDNELYSPRICANIIDTRTGRSLYRPYRVFNCDGFQIAVVGLLTPETGEQISKSFIPHHSFALMIDHAKRWINEIKKYENADYIVCILHSGLADVSLFSEDGDTIRDGLRHIVDSVPDIDLLLFGHDHGVYNDVMVNGNGDTINVFQSAAYGEEIGRIDIHFFRDKNGHLTKNTEMQRIRLDSLPIDKDYVAEFQSSIDTVNVFLDRPYGYVDEPLDMVGTLYKQTNAMDFIHAIQLMATGADISLSSALSTFRDIPEGPMTARTLFSLNKYNNQLHKVWMKGSEVKAFLEYGYARQFGVMTSANDHLLAFKYDNNGAITYGRFGPNLVVPQYNYTSAAGINYEVDVRKPAGRRVTILSMADGTPFDPNRQYTIAISSYQAAGGGGFVTHGLGWTKEDIAYHTLSVSARTLTKIIAEHIDSTKHLNPIIAKDIVGTWKVVPEEWSETVGAKDAQLLLPYVAK